MNKRKKIVVFFRLFVDFVAKRQERARDKIMRPFTDKFIVSVRYVVVNENSGAIAATRIGQEC